MLAFAMMAVIRLGQGSELGNIMERKRVELLGKFYRNGVRIMKIMEHNAFYLTVIAGISASA